MSKPAFRERSGPPEGSHRDALRRGRTEGGHKHDQGSLETCLQNLDRISEEFERCKRQGLPSPSLAAIDRLLGRT